MDIVGPIGSCRIASPLKAAAPMFGFRPETRLGYGFVHSTQEILQQIRYMAGDLLLPEWLWRCMSTRPYAGKPDGTIASADRHVVEISSIESYHLDGYCFQANRFKSHFGCARDCLRIFHAFPQQAQVPQRWAALDETPEFHRLGERDRFILAKTAVSIQSFEDVRDDIERIRSALSGPILFVSHCNVANTAGNLMPGRSRVIKYVTRACNKLGLCLLDPSPILQAYGQIAALADGGADLDHYSATFIPVMGEALGSAMYGAAHRAEPPRPALDGNWRAALAVARQAAQAADWPYALQAADAALAAVPDNGSALLFRARALTALGSEAAAVTDAWTAVFACQPDDAGRLMEAVRAAEGLGDFTLALQFASRAMARDGSPEAHLAAAKNQIRLGDLDAALAVLRSLARAAPERLILFVSESHSKGKLMQGAVAARAAMLESIAQSGLWGQTLLTVIVSTALRARRCRDYGVEAGMLAAAVVLDPDHPDVVRALALSGKDARVRLASDSPDGPAMVVQQNRLSMLGDMMRLRRPSEPRRFDQTVRGRFTGDPVSGGCNGLAGAINDCAPALACR